jgi:hypothetical protein
MIRPETKGEGAQLSVSGRKRMGDRNSFLIRPLNGASDQKRVPVLKNKEKRVRRLHEYSVRLEKGAEGFRLGVE